MNLYQYQKIGALWLASRKHAILADEMGLGKTPQAITAMMYAGLESALIICPAVVREQWKDEFAKWSFYNQSNIRCIESSDLVTNDLDAPIQITSYAMLQNPYVISQLRQKVFDVLIVDEAHYLKNMEAERTLDVLGGRGKGLVHSAKRRWFLSGTPVTGKPMDLFPVMSVIASKKLHPFTSVENFTKRFCNGYRDEQGHLQWSGSSNLSDLGRRLNGVMLRREVNEVRDDLPDAIKKPLPIVLSKSEMDRYKKYEASLEGNEYKKALLYNFIAGIKLKYIFEQVKNLLQKANKLIVFTTHDVMLYPLHSLLTDLEIPVEFVNGKVAVKKRKEHVRRYNQFSTGVLLAQMEASGIGVNGMEETTDTCLFGELPWCPDKMDQSIARLRRGEAKIVKAYIPHCKGTIDDEMIQILRTKKKVINSIYLKGK